MYTLRYTVARTRNHCCTGDNNALCVTVLLLLLLLLSFSYLSLQNMQKYWVLRSSVCVVNLCHRRRKLYVVFFEKQLKLIPTN